MLTIDGYVSRLLEADRRRRAASERGDELGEEEALMLIDDAETSISMVCSRNTREAISQNLVLIGRLRRLAQDQAGEMEHEAAAMAERLLDFLLQSTGLDAPSELRTYAYRWRADVPPAGGLIG